MIDLPPSTDYIGAIPQAVRLLETPPETPISPTIATTNDRLPAISALSQMQLASAESTPSAIAKPTTIATSETLTLILANPNAPIPVAETRNESVSPTDLPEPQSRVSDLIRPLQSREQGDGSDRDPHRTPSVNSLDITQKPTVTGGKQADYKIAPHVVPLAKVNPIMTVMNLNGMRVSHLTNWEFTSQFRSIEDGNSNIHVDGVYKINSQIKQSLSKDNIFTADQLLQFFQFQMVQTKRDITITRNDPQTLQGLQIQLSFTGACIGQASNADNGDSQCSLTPALTTDRSSIDPRFLVPTRIFQVGNFGDVISPETSEILSYPGFQNTGANGQFVGLDLYFPNIGGIPGNNQTNHSSLSRKEIVETNQIFSVSQVRQILRANHDRAVIGRTVRGLHYISDTDGKDNNSNFNVAFQLAAVLLPDVYPQITGSTEPVNTNINKNLFFAANNARIPDSSFTVYQAGLGSAEHSHFADGKQVTPSAIFNSIWLGFSPVTTFSIKNDFFYQLKGVPVTTLSTGAEGGANTHVNFLSLVNNDIIASADLSNFYTQIYLSFSSQNADFISISTLTERTRYYPHIAFTGNITNSSSVFRYYAGAIISPLPKLYIGFDYTKFIDTWKFNLEVMGYTNPDRDYYSHVSGGISKVIKLGPNANLTLSSAFNYAFDRDPNQLGNGSVNFVSLGARANFGRFSIGFTKYFDLLPNSISNNFTIDLALRLNARTSFTAYFSPTDTTSSYGIFLQHRFGDQPHSPSINIGWTRSLQDYGTDQFNNTLQTSTNTFMMLFRVGAPSRAF